MSNALPKGMRWLSRGSIWHVFDHKRVSVGAWTREEPARQAFAKLKPGATIVTCAEFGGWPPQFIGHVKRVALTVEIKASRRSDNKTSTR